MLSQNISGVVIDEDTREPLIGVNVILSNTNGTTTISCAGLGAVANGELRYVDGNGGGFSGVDSDISRRSLWTRARIPVLWGCAQNLEQGIWNRALRTGHCILETKTC